MATIFCGKLFLITLRSLKYHIQSLIHLSCFVIVIFISITILLQPGMSPVYGGGPPTGGPPGPGSSTPIMPSPQDSNTSSGDNMYPMMKPTSGMSGVNL